MRKTRLITALGIFLTVVLAAPTFGQFGPTCKLGEADLVAVKEKPGAYVGSFTGDIKGAVSLSTLKETVQRDGTILSLIELTYLSPRGEAGFHALLDVTDRPIRDGYARSAAGKITEATGNFAGASGDVSLNGRLSAESGQLKAKVEIRLCK